MTKDDIISLPDQRLRQSSQRVTTFDSQTQAIVEGMKAATLDWETSREHEVGVALAAVQIGELKRIVVVKANADDKSNHEFHVFINPEITKYEGEMVDDFEGCLSVPDIYGKVRRYQKVRVKALNEHGQEFRVKAEGFLARILQHEIDHTNGKVFVDHIKNKSDAFFKLTKEGRLDQLSYENDIKNNKVLWKE